MVPPARTVAAPIRAATTPPLVERCVRALGAGLPLGGWSYRPGPTSQPQVDGHLDLRLADRRVRFAIAARWRLGPDHLGPLQQLARRLAKADEHLLVCTDRVPPAVADELRALRIAYLDAGGNAWLDVDGLFVWVAGRAPAAPVRHRTRLRGTDLRLLGAFLCAGKDTSWNQRQWAARAGIALGAVGRSLRALTAHGLLQERGAHLHSVRDARTALASFAEGWATVLRPRLDPLNCRPLDQRWFDHLEDQLTAHDLGRRCLLGGELAAARLTGVLHTEHATLHVDPAARRKVMTTLGLVADPLGPVAILDRYGTADALPGRKGPWLIHPVLIHAELHVAPDERLTTTVEALEREWLAGTDHEQRQLLRC